MMNRLQKVTNGRDFNLESAPSQEALSISSTLIAYTLFHISELLDLDYITCLKLTQNGTFSLVGLN